MTKKKKSASKTKEPEQPESGGRAPIGLISATSLKKLVDRCRATQDKMSTLAGEMGEDIKDHATNKNLHRGAFSDIKKLYRMGKKDPAKLWLHLAHFDHMRAALKLDDLAESQGQLLDAGTGEGEPEGSFGAAREVSETAGAPVH